MAPLLSQGMRCTTYMSGGPWSGVPPAPPKRPFRSCDATERDQDAQLVPERPRLPLADLDAFGIVEGQRIEAIAEIDELAVGGLCNRLQDFRPRRGPGKLGARGRDDER